MKWITLFNIATVIFNIGLLGLTLKLYTEYFKDRSISKRIEPPKGKVRKEG
jgi:hypothetical protein